MYFYTVPPTKYGNPPIEVIVQYSAFCPKTRLAPPSQPMARSWIFPFKGILDISTPYSVVSIRTRCDESTFHQWSLFCLRSRGLPPLSNLVNIGSCPNVWFY
ncbi:hypothetical protein NPIL_118841 [Nephila pilipes]|uniref:Uncharacterized protein n=1 Tax=Nephila pilipes TaxID=299642 RepID=A0A8X6PSM5_NEPPI|nr:hypothetical protein NPIL_118841 [Nephila pilipes]